jgi:hypothetical protein
MPARRASIVVPHVDEQAEAACTLGLLAAVLHRPRLEELVRLLE